MNIGSGRGDPQPARSSEKFRRADLDLLSRVLVSMISGAVVAFRPFQRVAAFVIVPGFGELAAVLQRLAEREAKMIAIDRQRGRRPASSARMRSISSSLKR